MPSLAPAPAPHLAATPQYARFEPALSSGGGAAPCWNLWILGGLLLALSLLGTGVYVLQRRRGSWLWRAAATADAAAGALSAGPARAGVRDGIGGRVCRTGWPAARFARCTCWGAEPRPPPPSPPCCPQLQRKRAAAAAHSRRPRRRLPSTWRRLWS